MPPSFLVLEGPDGSGTTTHSRLLAERLRKEGHDVLLTAEPTEGPVGRFIRKQLGTSDLEPNTLQLLFTADRAWHVETIINPALEEGRTVICDRYTLSTLAYGEAQGLATDRFRAINDVFPKPEKTILLLPPLVVCIERISRRRTIDRFESLSFQKRVHEVYRRLAATHRGVTVIDSSGDKDRVAGKIWNVVARSIG
ncbi:dTMP kinase [Candidatus Peregrinibacteria bacterium]|nr:dTMP kinase [Candidatus Peregrinibacteria bacterium]MBI3816933.1 dTMP kinase [Candidatus Peregrinibacteria bacterium]